MPQCANKAAERSIASIEVRTSSTPKAPANDPHSSFQEQLLFICYALIAVDFGALETLPASLFSDITEQLNCSEMETSYLILGRTLGYCGATFATAFVMDRVEASHRYYSTILMLGVIATVVIPIVSEYYVQIMLWAVTGIANGTIDTSLPVYAYRQWGSDGSRKYVTFLVIYGVSKVVCPMMIQFSVDLFGSYRWALFIVAFIALCGAVMCLALPTPQHDELRSIQAALERQKSLRDAKEVQKEMGAHNNLKNAVVVLWVSLFLTYGVVQSGTLTHATVYAEYMGLSSGIGRYLISFYGAGQLSFRIFVTFAPQSVKRVVETSHFSMWYLFWMVVTFVPLTTMWLFMPLDWKLYTLFAIFPALGFAIGGLGPFSYRLVETVTPISGRISCAFMMCYGVGDFVIVLVNGELIQSFGAMIQPAGPMVWCLFVVPVVILTISLHRRYQQIRNEIIRPAGSVKDNSDSKAGEETSPEIVEDETDCQDFPAMADGYSNSVPSQSAVSTVSSVGSDIPSADELRGYETK